MPSSDSFEVFDYQRQRLLFLDGDKGSVASRIHGELTCSTRPHLSEAGRVELATRTLLRMKNLSAIRGVPGASMVGPADYYGNIERPSEHLYTIEIDNGVPQLYQLPPGVNDNGLLGKMEIAEENITRVNAKWTSGTDKEAIDIIEPKYSQNGSAFGESLFPNPGILEIESDDATVHLKSFDATQVDLSSFKARLVANDRPFHITAEPLPASDEYRAVSFLYEPGYGNAQVTQGGGLFLETHTFAQTMTPLDENAQGFVVLGRWVDEEKTQLDLISIKIPYGYTLIIEENCIHGDATLDGMFMMCMTSNHVTMQTADSVFLKNPQTARNINLVVDGDEDLENRPEPVAPRPHVLYQGHNYEAMSAFLEETKNKSFIFNPFSAGFWHRAVGLVRNSDMSLPILGGVMAAVGVTAVVLAFGIINATTLGVAGLCIGAIGAVVAVVGLGLFAGTLPDRHRLPADAYVPPMYPLLV